jgi:hypothetical protein
MKVWPEEKADIKELERDSTSVARITTADNIVDGEPKVQQFFSDKSINFFFS